MAMPVIAEAEPVTTRDRRRQVDEHPGGDELLMVFVRSKVA